MHNQKPHTLAGTGLLVQGVFEGVEPTGTLPSFLAVYCSVQATTQTNRILILRSCLIKHKMKIFVDNTPTFVYIYFHEEGFISAIAHQ